MADCTLEDGRLAYTPTTDAERQAYETGYHDHKVGRSPQLAPYTGPLYTLWLAGWDAAQTGQTLYTLEAGQIYARSRL
jgi:ribosome modulation factor